MPIADLARFFSQSPELLRLLPAGFGGHTMFFGGPMVLRRRRRSGIIRQGDRPPSLLASRALSARVPVQRSDQLGGGFRRAHSTRHDVAVFEFLPIQRGVVIQVLAQCGPFQGEASK